jgi:hypothetical protein
MSHADAGKSVNLATVPYRNLPFQGNRSRISWGAVIAGAVVAVATSLLLSLLGAAIGAGSINVLDASSSELTSYGTGAAIWQAINFILSMGFGGYVASRLSGTHSHLDGELHGVTMWGLAVLLSSLLLAQAISSMAGFVGREAGSVVNRAVSNAGTLSGLTGPEADSRTTLDRLESVLSNSNDPTTMSHDQIGREITGLVGTSLSNGSLSEPDRDRLASLVAAQYGITKDDATQRVVRMENDLKTRLVSQYLRGVSFPVNKQDLIRMARSSNAGSGLLHSIEGMTERSYATPGEVLRELNSTH